MGGKNMQRWTGFVCLLLAAVVRAGAQEEDPQAAAMEHMMQLATPGVHHKHLARFSGNWSATSRFRWSPDQPWSEHKMESKVEMIFGGRFAKISVKGEPLLGSPVPFEGLGILGYDNQTATYTSVWVDNMGTMTVLGEGSCENDGKVIHFTSSLVDPMSGEDTWMRSVYKLEREDAFTLELWIPGPDGEEFLSMETRYTRKK